MREAQYGLRRNGIAAGVLAATVATSSAHAAGLFLYEMATPDLGTASAGRAAGTDNAATAFGNPAGMTRLDQSQMLVGLQPAYGITRFDKGDDTTVSGGNGGNALGFIPGMGGYFVYSATPDLKFGLSLGSDFGLSARYQSNWSGRYYALQEEIITLGAFPVAAYRINPWLSVGAGAQIIYGKLNSKTGINDVLDGGDASIDVGEVSKAKPTDHSQPGATL
jgi:long-chain fatty acid transport protein